MALWLQHLGARNIVVSDPAPARRQAASQLGATATIDPTSGDVAAAMADICGGAPSRVIECVGVPGLLQAATEVASVDGVVTVAGVCMEPEQLTPLVSMVKELDVRFAFSTDVRTWSTPSPRWQAGRLDPLGMITDEIALDELPTRFERLKSPGPDCKVLVRPSA